MDLKFALIGCGRIAQRHAENMNKTGKLVAVCDVIPEKAIALGNLYTAAVYNSIESLLENHKDLDVAAICTPNGLHALHSIQCLRAGINVLCEKPLCISVANGKAMLEAATLSGKRLFVVKQNRYNPPVIELKRLLKENKLGKIYSFQVNCFWNRPNEYYHESWKGTKSMDGGTLFTQFSHFIDLIYWLLGDVKEVMVKKKNYAHPSIEFEDTGAVIMEMQTGVLGTLQYTVNSYAENMEGSFTIFGEKGTVKIGGQYLNELEYAVIEDYDKQQLPEGNPSNQYGIYQGSMSNHDKVYENLIKTMKDPAHEFTSAEDGLKTVEIIEKIYAA